MALIRRLARGMKRPLGAVLERRLGGYRRTVNDVDARAPLRATAPASVAVLGGGLAGIAAAATLADRGFRVTLFEANERIGGKIGGETITIDGQPYPMDHGFHAFFRHYYNLDAFLARVGVKPALEAIDDYVILDADGREWSFGDVETTPGLNLLDLAGKDLYRLGEVMFSGAHRHMNAFLAYDRDATFAGLDRTSFSEWADRAGLPKRLRRVLTIFARAFFAEDDRLSAAEVVKAFHFYYLAHDKGLLYDYPRRAYLDGIVVAIEAHLDRLGVSVCTRSPARVVAPLDDGVEVDGTRFDHAVVATPAREARALALRSPLFRAACPDTTRRLASLEDGQRYAVLRIWIDRDIRAGLPVFVTTERTKLLDAVASYHRITETDATWVARRGGAVLELHSYAVPDDLPDDGAVREALLSELARFFPEIAGFTIAHEHLRVRNDFTALHVGMAADRPVTATDHSNVVLAGDWVSLPVPAMLMEGAFTSGLYAANTILARAGLQEAPIESVPLRGLLADMPSPIRAAAG
mgnify:CR=1 FL=1